ncbi:MAG: transcriptional repressor [Gammaproteobacteria bacterium]|nr:transcriptional repressor [Gammaproteobacteria bacterium]
MLAETERRTSKIRAVDVLRQYAIAPTQQRVEIAQLLLSKPQHVTAEQVMAMVNVDRPRVSKATVYNTLGLFARKGLVKEVIVDPTKIFYDSNIDSHYHFYCITTGQLWDVGAETVQLRGLPPPPEGAVVDSVDVIIRLRPIAPPPETDEVV